MTITVPKRCQTDIPGVLSEQTGVYGTPPGFFPTNYDENIFYYDPNGSQAGADPTNPDSRVPFRLINVLVTDFSASAADRTVTYIAPNGEPSYLICNRNGEHPVGGYGIVSVGSAIDLPSLQVIV